MIFLRDGFFYGTRYYNWQQPKNVFSASRRVPRNPRKKLCIWRISFSGDWASDQSIVRLVFRSSFPFFVFLVRSKENWTSDQRIVRLAFHSSFSILRFPTSTKKQKEIEHPPRSQLSGVISRIERMLMTRTNWEEAIVVALRKKKTPLRVRTRDHTIGRVKTTWYTVRLQEHWFSRICIYRVIASTKLDRLV